MDYRWTGIIEFVNVVEKGSFSAAAKALDVSKSHVSKQVRALEKSLGVQLLHRTTRKQTLTNQGVDFFMRCQKILQNLEEARNVLGEELTTPRGQIRLTAAGAFGEEFLAPVLADFLTLYPEVTMEVSFTNRLVDIQEEHFDLAIRTGLPDREHFSADKLYSYRLVTAASRSYLDRHGVPQLPDELENHNCLVGTLPYWRFRSGEDIREVVVRGNWKSNNGRALIKAAEAGLGILQVPEFYLDYATTDTLVPLLEDYSLDNVTMWAMYPSQQYVPRRVSLLMEFLKQSLRDSPKTA
ncbi:LysR family transcriptional regulator [Emcibacter nanhaiensis]|uniref:LysR family transcriptional regulator n=1 Tax=Emcibacter nanhaiensis TaxID=1505037 RepID=A0A501PGQ9_9PROT|nr:LysR family transcriptional regulator [Emcibacter nanhaiensis]TPD59144.1 LysR family transcriptional regulator [Emcibacter nanhaiensis]